VTRLLALLLVVVVVACAPARPAAKVLRVGSSGDYAPFSIHTEAGWGGFDVEVARRFAQDTGRTLELVEFRWPALEPDLAANRFDVAMSGVTMRPWRVRVGTFTRPIARAGAVVVTWPAIAATLEDLEVPARRIGVNAGGYLERVARRLFPRAEIVPIADNRRLAEHLHTRTVEAIVADEFEAPIFQRVLPATVAIGPLTNDRKAYLAREPALADELDAWLRAREVDGSLAAVRARVLGPQWGRPNTALASDLDALLSLIELRLAFMPAVGAAKEQLGLPTDDPAQEARVLADVRAHTTLFGITPAHVEPLFAAMLQASRNIQNEYRARPPNERPAIEAMDLETESRPALARISRTIVARAADVARGQPLDPRPSAAIVADALDPSLASPEDRLAIAEAVVRVLPTR
jgi:cyclohexadienyl dehydratase